MKKMWEAALYVLFYSFFAGVGLAAGAMAYFASLKLLGRLF